jgi:hypothetical protein
MGLKRYLQRQLCVVLACAAHLVLARMFGEEMAVCFVKLTRQWANRRQSQQD